MLLSVFGFFLSLFHILFSGKNLFRITLIVVASLLFAEAFTRVAVGIKPGFYINDPWFTPVDQLELMKGFYTDSAGIQKVSPEVATEVAQRMNSFIPSFNNHECGEIYYLAFEYRKVVKGFLFFPPDKKWQQYFNDDTSWNKLMSNYLSHPINDEGFRSIPFAPYNGKRKKLLLIGDSFVWGHSASPVTNSFADLLLKKGYVVYNTGISGADPPQYLAVAKKYIPLLKPDVVVVNVFLGNDLFVFDRPVLPCQPIFYNTNAGNLYTDPDGIMLSPERSYELAKASHSIPLTSRFNRFCAGTAFATLFWRALNKYHLVDNYNPVLDKYYKQVESLALSTPTLSNYLNQIKKVSDSAQCKMLVIAIPDLNGNSQINKKEVLRWFNGFPFQFSPVPQREYDHEDGHFNNEGHKDYAAFIEQKIREL
jgi:hypothetical protein